MNSRCPFTFTQQDMPGTTQMQGTEEGTQLSPCPQGPSVQQGTWMRSPPMAPTDRSMLWNCREQPGEGPLVQPRWIKEDWPVDFLHCWWECKWKRVWRFLKKLKIELPYDPAIPLPGMYPKKILIQKDTCTPMFIAAWFTIAKLWKQPKCPLTDEWIKKMWSIYTMECYSAIKRNEIVPFAATRMDLEMIILRGVSQIDKDNIIWYHLYVESKIWRKWTYWQNRNRLTGTENRLVAAKGEGRWGRDGVGVWG